MAESQPGWMRTLWERILHLAQRALDALFHAPHDPFSRAVHTAVIAALFLWGILLWGRFFSWGNLSFDFLDWAEVTGPRYALLRDAAEKGVLPLHAGNTTALRGVTDRYFSIADTPFLPHYLLLPYLETGQFIFNDTLLFYAVGFAGLVLFYRKYRLSPLAFALLFLLFNFNGNVTGHLAVGHSIWNGHFLLPYFILLVFSLVEHEKVSWGWHLGLALSMLLVLGAGYFHLYFWCLLFLSVLALFNWHLVKPVFWAGLFTVLASLPRLLPPSLALSGITQEYLGGFPSLTDMLAGMVSLSDPNQIASVILSDTRPLQPWETDFYIGLLGLALLLVFGVLLPLRSGRSRLSFHMQILIASLVFGVFSIGQVFAWVMRVLPIPPFTGERVSARMFILPLMFVLFLAVIYLQRELSSRRLPVWVQVLCVGLAALLYHDLGQHLRAWRVRFLDQLVYLFPKVPFDPAQHTIVNHPDPLYTAMLAGGAAVALGVLVFLAVMALRRPKAA